MYDMEKNFERALCKDRAYAARPAVSDNKIVWQDRRDATSQNNLSFDIYMYDLEKNEETRVTEMQHEQSRPDISGNMIVYSGMAFHPLHLYAYNLKSKQHSQVDTLRMEEEDNYSISGRTIACYKSGVLSTSPGIFIYDVNSLNRETIIEGEPNSCWYGTINNSGNAIAWSQPRFNNSYDIFVHDRSTGNELRITTDDAYNLYPYVKGNNLIWVNQYMICILLNCLLMPSRR
ncbi:cell surface protein [sediment metagenome]|uniref:Cell surface protein n=1 Tax=sediment metagenome TaxID=749907 RepID=D9PIM7_9ZZZZ